MDERSSRAADARQRSGETKRRRTRAAILAAADEVLARRGWVGTTMEAIAAEAGVGVATVYGHFPTKAAIAAWVMRSHLEDVVGDAAPDHTAWPAPEALAWFLDRLSRASHGRRHLLAAIVSATAELPDDQAPLGPSHPASISPTVQVCAAIIERGQRDGSFLPYPPALDVARILNHSLLVRVVVRAPGTAEETSLLIRTLASRLLGCPDPS